MRRSEHPLRQYPGLRSILRNGFWQSALTLYTLVIRLGYIFVASRLLGPEDYGFFAYAQTYYLTFLPLIALGFDVMIPREIGRKSMQTSDWLQRTFSLRITLAVAVAVLAAAVAVVSEEEGSHVQLMILICLALVPRAFYGWCGAVFLGFEQSSRQMVFAAVFRTAEVAAGAAALFFLDAGLFALVLIHLVCWLGYTAFACLYIHRRLVPLRFALCAKDWPMLGGENLLLAVQMFLGVLLMNAPLLLYRHTAPDPEAYGQFALAFQGVTILCGLLGAFNAAAAPVLARSHARQDGKDRRYALGMSALFFLVGGVIVAALYLVGEEAVLWIMGPAYGETAAMLAKMALWLPFAAAALPPVLFLQMRGRAMPVISARLLGLAGMGAVVLVLEAGRADHVLLAVTVGMGMVYGWVAVNCGRR